MNALDALRTADPARNFSRQSLAAADERVLHEILSTSPASVASPRPGAARPIRTWASGRTPAIVTALVAAVVVALGVIAIGSTSTTRRDIAATPAQGNETLLQGAVYAKLAEVAGDVDAARNSPGLTWTDHDTGAAGGPLFNAGKTVWIAAACDGGGSITITISGRDDTTVGCSALSTVGPIPLTNSNSVNDGLSVDVKTASGAPRYVAKLIAVAP